MKELPQQIFSLFARGLIGLLNFLYYAIIVSVVAYLVWKYWETIRIAVQQFLQTLRDFWARLWGRSTETPVTEPEGGPVAPPPRAFASYADPFLSGEAYRWPAPTLVRYSFAALEAWSRERGFPRTAEQTAHEFLQELAEREPAVARQVGLLADLYGRTAYSPTPLPTEAAHGLKKLWGQLSASAPQGVTA